MDCLTNKTLPRGSNYPIFEVSDPQSHLWYGISREKTSNHVECLDPLGEIKKLQL